MGEDEKEDASQTTNRGDLLLTLVLAGVAGQTRFMRGNLKGKEKRARDASHPIPSSAALFYYSSTNNVCHNIK